MENSPYVVRSALSTGAQGYVYKARIQSDLVPAIHAVLRGIQFISSKLREYKFTEANGAKAPHRHEVQFYSDDTALLDSLVRFVAVALEAGDVAIAVATRSHRDGILQRLKARGLDVGAAIKDRRYIPLDAADTLSRFMVNGMPDADRFCEVVGGLVETAAKRGKAEDPRPAIFGEMVALLLAEGNVDATIRLEQLWNRLAAVYEFDLLCGYDSSSFHIGDQLVFQSVCSEHSAVYSQ
jgi:MEDS: MEthanogen/methylotroph, DcmR Sensory domain